MASRMSSTAGSAGDLARPRFKVHGPVVDHVIDAARPPFDVRIWRIAIPRE